MLYWIWDRRAETRMLSRSDRRALTRLSRPTRGVVDPIVAKLKRLPIRDRLAVLDSLPAAHRLILEERL